MIDREGPVPHSHLNAPAHSKFVGMNLRNEPHLLSCCEDALRVADGEEAFVTKNIDEIG